MSNAALPAGRSRFLEPVLQRRAQRLEILKKNATYQKELVLAAELTTAGVALRHRERRQQHLRELIAAAESMESRWESRLQTLSSWQQDLGHIQSDKENISREISAIHWLRKAKGAAERLAAHLAKGIERTQEAQIRLHDELECWLQLLQRKSQVWTEIKAKEREKHRPILFSRARKQPETEFIAAAQEMGQDLGSELTTLRASANRARQRLERAMREVQRRAPQGFVAEREALLSRLEGAAPVVAERRDAVLDDALEFEAGRRLLLDLEQNVKSLQCVEDVYRAPAPWWRRVSPLAAKYHQVKHQVISQSHGGQ